MSEDRTPVIEAKLDQLMKELDRVSTLLLGKDGQPGIQIRLDRVEQAYARVSKLFWLALGAAATALAKGFL